MYKLPGNRLPICLPFARRRMVAAVGAAIACGALSTPAAADNVDTMSVWNGTTFISSWGVPNTATYGQTITAASGQSTLNGFTFQLAQQSGTAPQYQAFVYQWDAATQRIVGNALYTSAIVTAPTTASATTYAPVSFTTGGIRLGSGTQYVIFLTTSTVTGQANATYRWGSLTNNASYAGGQFVFFNNGTNFGQLSSGNWSTIAQDLAMLLQFGAGSLFSSATGALNNRSATGAAGALDSIIANPTNISPDMQNLVNQFNQLGGASNETLSGIAGQTTPLFAGGMGPLTLNTLRDTANVVQSRVDDTNGLAMGGFSAERGMAAGDAGGRDAWLKPFGSWARQDVRSTTPGYDASTYGLLIGADTKVGMASRLGLAFGYAATNVDGVSGPAPNNAKIKSYQLIGYGTHKLMDDRTDLTWQASYGVGDNTGRRNLDFVGRVATSSYTSQLAHLGVAVSRAFPLSARTTLIPSLRADYGWVRANGYMEDGAGALNLNVNSATSEEFIIGAGARVVHKLDENRQLSANLGVGYDTINRETQLTSSFAGGGPTFITQGIKPSPWLVRGGLGFSFNAKRAQVTARYDVEAREQFTNQTASVNVRVPF